MTNPCPPDFAPAAAVTARGVAVRYGPFTALADVNLMVQAGEIHALLGENGAGKSTLIKVLAGERRPDSGDVTWGQDPNSAHGAPDSTESNVAVVHQHFMLVPAFSVAENLLLDAPRASRRFRLSSSDALLKAREIARDLGWDIPWGARTGDLPVGVQQRVEILKALMRSAQVLLFDEPTAVLAPSEIEDLFRVLRRLRSENKAIVFVSHKLSEVLAISDRISVLRKGQNVATVLPADVSARTLASLMVGEATTVSDIVPHASSDQTSSEQNNLASGTPALVVCGLCTKATPSTLALQDLSFEIAAGETLGIAGVDGNGQQELADALLGFTPLSAGDVSVRGVDLAGCSTQHRLDAGLAFVPPDRHRQGLALDLSVRENLLLGVTGRPEFRRGPILLWRRLHAYADALAQEYDIRSPGPNTPVALLSGGNQQKIVLARALHNKPKVLVASNPTRGLDVGAAQAVYDALRQAREEGTAVLLISTELDDVIAQSDRIAVLHAGRIMGIVPSSTGRSTIGAMMGGLVGATHGSEPH